MPIVLGCFAILTPRVVLFMVWLFGGGYLGRAFATTVWPVLGFLFMPLTTLAYAFAMNQNNGNVSGYYLAMVIVAALIDVGSVGGQAGRRKRRR